MDCGCKLVVQGKMPSSQHLVVSNHQGILDSLLHMAISPCMVISNMLIRNMKVIGAVMELLGFVFVDRSRRKSIVELLQPATSMITKSRVNMSFFPEGKSSDGVELLPFNSPTLRLLLILGQEFSQLHSDGLTQMVGRLARSRGLHSHTSLSTGQLSSTCLICLA